MIKLSRDTIRFNEKNLLDDRRSCCDHNIVIDNGDEFYTCIKCNMAFTLSELPDEYTIIKSDKGGLQKRYLDLEFL